MKGKATIVLLMLTALAAPPGVVGDSLWPATPACVQPVDETGYTVQACVGGSICYAVGGQTHVFVCLDPSYCPAGTHDVLPADTCRGPDDVDNDGDGWTVADGDCDDNDPMLNPGEPERADGIDNDCDGEIDEAS